VIIRWKDLFARLEVAIDSCEKAAHILDGIALKVGTRSPLSLNSIFTS